MTWVAVDSKTDRIVAIGTQSEASSEGTKYFRLSGNRTIVRKLKVGMILKEYD